MIYCTARAEAEYPLCINSLADAEVAVRLAGGEVGDDGLPGNGGLSLGDERPRSRRQIDIHARAEANHADALASCHCCTLAHETHNSSRDQTRDLHHTDVAPVARDEQTVALVALARLVEVGADERAGMIDHALDRSAERAAVHVTIEYAHEDRHPRPRPPAQFHPLR